MKFIFLDEVTPIIFPAHLAHCDVAEKFPEKKVISAGYIGFRPDSNGLHTYGDSHSLSLGPGKDDEFLINRFFGKRE